MTAWPQYLATERLRLSAGIAPGSSSVEYQVIRDGEVVGSVRLDPIEGQRAFRLRVSIQPPFRRIGYATEAGAAVCEVAFQRAERLEIHDDGGARVARRLGFVRGTPPVWIGERGPASARAALVRACRGVAAASICDDGTIRIGPGALRVCAVAGQPQALALCDVGHESVLDSRACLMHNATLGAGALSVVGERLVLRLLCPAYAITPEMIRLFLHEAERLRGLTPRPLPSAAAAVYNAFSD